MRPVPFAKFVVVVNASCQIEPRSIVHNVVFSTGDLTFRNNSCHMLYVRDDQDTFSWWQWDFIIRTLGQNWPVNIKRSLIGGYRVADSKTNHGLYMGSWALAGVQVHALDQGNHLAVNQGWLLTLEADPSPLAHAKGIGGTFGRGLRQIVRVEHGTQHEKIDYYVSGQATECGNLDTILFYLKAMVALVIGF